MSAQHGPITSPSVACLRHIPPVSIDAAQDVVEAAQLMREKHVGFLVVTQLAGGRTRIVGALTDRDIVVAVIARGADPRALKVGDVMTRDPLIVSDNCSLDAALGFMREACVRRVPVVGSNGELCGVLSVDDVLERLAVELTNIAGCIRGEQSTERLVRP